MTIRVVVGHGDNLHYRELHSENFHFSTVVHNVLLFPTRHPIPNKGAKSAYAVALCLSLTHPERCATQNARICQKSIRIFHGMSHRRKRCIAKARQNVRRCLDLYVKSLARCVKVPIFGRSPHPKSALFIQMRRDPPTLLIFGRNPPQQRHFL